MRNRKLLSAVALAMACSLATVGCGLGGRGGEDDNRHESIDKDWRTTGSYVDATFYHEGTVDVLFGFGENKLTIFYDSEDKDVYESVHFPFETTDVQATSESLLVYDINDDGFTDFSIDLFDQNGEFYTVEYIWNADTCVFVENSYSGGGSGYVDEGDFSFTNFIGAWTPDDHSMEIIIDAVGNWQRGANEELYYYGNSEIVDGSVVLYSYDGYYYITFVYEDGHLVDEEGTIFYYDGPVEDHLNGESFVYTGDGYDYEEGSSLRSGYYYLQDDNTYSDYIYIYDGLSYERYGRIEGVESIEILDAGYLVPVDDGGNFIAYSTYYDDPDGCEVFEFDFGVLFWGDAVYTMD